MTKEELYNKIVDLYKKTGQGTPTFVGKKVGMDLVDELVDDGLIKIVTQPFSYLADDVTMCLTKGYCVEEDGTEELTYIRMYLSIDPVIQLGKYTLTLADSFKKPDFVKKYSDWLTKNFDKLEEMEKIEHIAMGDGSLSESDTEYLKSRAWYKEDLIISECITRMEGYDPQAELSRLNEIINLKQNPYVAEKYAESVKEDIKERVIILQEIKLRKRIQRWLDEQDKNVNIQSLI